MSTQKDQNFVTKTRNEFVLSAENAIKEIHDKFANFHSQLNRGEIDLINNVEKVQADILRKFDEITPKLKEIQQLRDSTISILRNNSNKQLLETQLSSFTAEIDRVIGQSEIDKLIRLKWKYCELPINDVCTIATINPKESVRHSPQANISHERPGVYTHPQPGQDTRFQNPNIGQDTRFPQNPNIGQDTRFPQNPNIGQDTRFPQNPNIGQDTRFQNPNIGQDTRFPQNPNIGQDTRFPQNPNIGLDTRFHNPNPEIAQVDILPARGPKPTLTPGNMTS